MKYDTDIELIEVDTLQPYENNAKKHPQSQVEKLAAHIEKVGWDQPIVIDESFVVLKGHGRLLAAKHLGLHRVPVITKVGLTEKEKKLIRLADNKLAESPWDTGLLEAELLNLDIPMIELADIGFEMIEPVGFEFTPPKELDDDKPEVFMLRVTFENYEEQQALFNELRDRGFKVKV
jgi:ParB-like chromosome segregation protein Spo0J